MSSYDLHASQIEKWIASTFDGLSPQDRVLAFERAVAMLQSRILQTLSPVTLNALLERILLESVVQYPFLSGLSVGKSGLTCAGLLKNVTKQAPPQLTDGLSYFIKKLFYGLHNLTAGVVTPSLLNGLEADRAKVTKDRGDS